MRRLPRAKEYHEDCRLYATEFKRLKSSALNRTCHGDLNLTEGIRRHVFDGHIGNVEWNLKGLAHRRTRLSGG